MTPSTSSPRHRGPQDLSSLLSDRDRAILAALRAHRLLSASHIERLLFTGHHASPIATRRRCQAVLRRLVDDELLARLDRRLGGHRAGSTGFVYRLTSRGFRAIGVRGKRARWEPSQRHLHHVLGCAEISVQLHEAARAGLTTGLQVTHEPDTWRRFIGRHGRSEILKPDLLAEFIDVEGWEVRWFIEIDRATEHLPTVIAKCQQYQHYWHSGQETRISTLFPRVLWSVPNQQRSDAIEAAIHRTSGLSGELFQTATTEQTLALLLGKQDI